MQLSIHIHPTHRFQITIYTLVLQQNIVHHNWANLPVPIQLRIPRQETQHPRLFNFMTLFPEISLTLITPLNICTHPLCHAIHVRLDLQAQRTAPARNLQIEVVEFLHHLSMQHCRPVNSPLNVRVMFFHGDGDEIMLVITGSLLFVVRENIL
jgi:hypothetical protein